MDHLFLAIFESALLSNVGIPTREIYDLIRDAYLDDLEIKKLFEDLASDWDSPQIALRSKMIGPFIERETKHPDFLLCRAFTEAAAFTGMVDKYWMSCGYAYALKKRLAKNSVEEADIQLARELFAVLAPDHPVFNYLFSISNDPAWGRATFLSSSETLSFQDWVNYHALRGKSVPIRCMKAFEKSAERLASPEILDKSLSLWKIYSTALSNE